MSASSRVKPPFYRMAMAAAAVAAMVNAWLKNPILTNNLNGQFAVVTGGGRGLGRGITLALVEAGATVYITGRTRASLEATCELASAIAPSSDAVVSPCIPKVVDSRNDTGVEAFFAELSEETSGRLDILVNNAYSGVGYWGKNKLLGRAFWEAPIQLFDEVFDVGVRAHYKATMLAVPLMQKQGGGLIINSNSPGCIIYAVNVWYTATRL